MIILTLLFLLFGIGCYGCYLQPNMLLSNTNNTQLVEKKVRDNYINSANGFFLTSNDFVSCQFANVLFGNIQVLGSPDFNNFPSSVRSPSVVNQSWSASIGDYVNGSPLARYWLTNTNNQQEYPSSYIYNGGINIFQIDFTKTLINIAGNTYFYRYTMTFISRDGGGNSINLIRYNYDFVSPFQYKDNMDNYYNIGNLCSRCGIQFHNSSPITESNYSQYVYGETTDLDNIRPMYMAYYGGLTIGKSSRVNKR